MELHSIADATDNALSHIIRGFFKQFNKCKIKIRNENENEIVIYRQQLAHANFVAWSRPAKERDGTVTTAQLYYDVIFDMYSRPTEARLT